MLSCRRMMWAAGFLTAAILSPSAVQAQGQRGGGMGGGMAGPGLIASPAVQKELKLSEEQNQKAASFATAFREKAREAYTSTEGLEGQERMTKMQEITRAYNAAGMKEVEAMLKPEQAKRFKGIVLQARGYEAFTDPMIVKHFKITKEQEDKIKGLAETARAEMGEARQSAGDDREAMMASMTKIRKDTNAKALALMTPEQTTMYKEMAGEPFEVPPMAGGRPAR